MGGGAGAEEERAPHPGGDLGCIGMERGLHNRCTEELHSTYPSDFLLQQQFPNSTHFLELHIWLFYAYK